jgi:hypothetical protein
MALVVIGCRHHNPVCRGFVKRWCIRNGGAPGTAAVLSMSWSIVEHIRRFFLENRVCFTIARSIIDAGPSSIPFPDLLDREQRLR